MIKFNYKIFVFILFIIQISYGKLPPTIKTCPRNHPEPEKCILSAVEAVRPLLAKGDLGGGFQTPPLEPLILEDIKMGRGREFQAVFSELKATGGSNFIAEQLKSNITTLSFAVTVLLPKIEFSGKYTMHLRILLLDINGKGDMKGSFKNARGICRLRGSTYKKDGKNYVKFDKLSMKIQIVPGSMKLQLDNLFNGDPVLGEVGNSIINDNQELYLQEIIPGLEKSLSKQFLDISNKILVDATYDEMFPLS